MKLSIIIITLIFIFQYTAKSQTFTKNEVDEFTGAKVVETSWEKFNKQGPSITYFRFRKIDSEIILELKGIFYIGVFIVNKDDPFMLKLENDKMITLLNKHYVISSIGDGAISFFGSEAMGIDLSFVVSPQDIDLLMQNHIIKFRLYTSSGYVEQEIKAKFYDKFKRALMLIKFS